jgi:hypothetical protein
MRKRSLFALVPALILSSSFALAKEKQKNLISPVILAAHTVSVVIDPEAGTVIDDPLANQAARRDVETALANWGRFQTNTVGQPSDLIIVIRRGHEHVTEATIPDSRQNERTGAINPLDNGIQMGARQGQQPNDPATGRPIASNTPSTQAEIAGPEDIFAVYDGTLQHPFDAPALWRYNVQDGLHPHSVPAVAVFRKAVTDSEKAAAKKP